MKKIKYITLDTITMFKRCMLLSFRNPDTLFLASILPVAMMILFVYVFGGAMNVGEMDYVNYIVPGVIILAIGQSASMTAIHIKGDIEKGIADRFRSMPISKSSLLIGHVMASGVRNTFATVLVIIVALLMGFEPKAGLLEWLICAGVLLLYMLTITWASVLFGLMSNSVESAGMFQMIIMLLPYLSSGFVTVSTMPFILQVFSENQPLTPIIESVRSIMMYSIVDEYLLSAILWCIVLLIVTYISSMWIYKYKANH